MMNAKKQIIVQTQGSWVQTKGCHIFVKEQNCDEILAQLFSL